MLIISWKTEIHLILFYLALKTLIISSFAKHSKGEKLRLDMIWNQLKIQILVNSLIIHKVIN